MSKNTTDTASEWESVKLKKEIIDLVRQNKEKTGVPVSTFFEQAAFEKLKKQKKVKE